MTVCSGRILVDLLSAGVPEALADGFEDACGAAGNADCPCPPILVGREERDEVLLEPAGVVDDVAAGDEQI
jgi:hypothetical protein